MITCPNCQLENPGAHKFCQRCGEPLPVISQSDDLPESQPESQPKSQPESQSSLQPNIQRLSASLMPPDKRTLSPATYLDAAERYQVVTVLSPGHALVSDRTPDVRSPLQSQLSKLTGASITNLQNVEDLPTAAYPYLILADAAPPLYDVMQQNDITLLITPERTALLPLLKSLSDAVDPLQYVYWMYRLIELWTALAPVPQWRSSLIQANNLGIDIDQSLRIRHFIEPSIQPPKLSDLKGFLQSLLAQPHRGKVPSLRQIRKIILAVNTATTLKELSHELETIGKDLLNSSEPMTPNISHKVSTVNTHPQPLIEDMDVNSDDDELNKALPSNNELTETDDATMLLPMRLGSLLEAGRTDVGRQRDHNEDCFLIVSSHHKRADNNGQYTRAHGLYVLCDGMGGHDGGEVASELAAQTLSTYFDEHWPIPTLSQPDSPLPKKSVVVEAVKLANQAIFEVNDKESRAGHKRMGTTLVLVLIQGTEAVVAHVGDSRLYQFNRRTGIQQVTVDHEVGQREMQRGIPEAVAYARPDAYQLTQALGPRDSADLNPSVTYLKFVEDTLLLLCSDGLSDNNVVEDYLDSHISPLLMDKKALSSGLDELVDLANQVNGHDNISAIALQIKVTPDLSQTKPKPNASQTVLQ